MMDEDEAIRAGVDGRDFVLVDVLVGNKDYREGLADAIKGKVLLRQYQIIWMEWDGRYNSSVCKPYTRLNNWRVRLKVRDRVEVVDSHTQTWVRAWVMSVDEGRDELVLALEGSQVAYGTVSRSHDLLDKINRHTFQEEGFRLDAPCRYAPTQWRLHGLRTSSPLGFPSVMHFQMQTTGRHRGR
jgi:hypothetical protein